MNMRLYWISIEAGLFIYKSIFRLHLLHIRLTDRWSDGSMDGCRRAACGHAERQSSLVFSSASDRLDRPGRRPHSSIPVITKIINEWFKLLGEKRKGKRKQQQNIYILLKVNIRFLFLIWTWPSHVRRWNRFFFFFK